MGEQTQGRQLLQAALNAQIKSQCTECLCNADGTRRPGCSLLGSQAAASWHKPHSPRAIQPSCSPRGLHVPCHAGYNLWERQGWFCIPSAGGFMSLLNSTSGKNPAITQHIPSPGGDLKPTHPWEWAMGCGREEPEGGGGGGDVCSRAVCLQDAD